MIEIFQAKTHVEIEGAITVFREYEAWLGLDLCFQGFEDELKNLPGKYAPPSGRLYLARSDGELAGCIAMRSLGDDVCEMKRLYVRKSFRGLKLGRLLIERLIDDAREIGYKRMQLDTFPPKMGKAVRLYEAYGFREIPPYYDNPNEDVLFMEKVLLPLPVNKPFEEKRQLGR